jgi:glutaredoxin
MAASAPAPWRSLLQLGALVLAVSFAHTWWQGRQAQSVGDTIAALAAPGDIRMISSETCGPCLAARQWLQRHEVAFSECLIERDAACRAEFEAWRAPGTPVIVVRGQPQLGFQPERLAAALQPPAR